jgi:WD40 repeat protein
MTPPDGVAIGECDASPDSQRLVTGTNDGVVAKDNPAPKNVLQIWNGETGAPIGKPMPTTWSMSVSFSPDQSKIIAAGLWWDAATGRSLSQFPAPALNSEVPPVFTPPIPPFVHNRGLVFSPALRAFWIFEAVKVDDDPMMIGFVSKVRLWDLATGKARGPYLDKLLSPHGPAIFNSDGRLFVVAIDSGTEGRQLYEKV